MRQLTTSILLFVLCAAGCSKKDEPKPDPPEDLSTFLKNVAPQKDPTKVLQTQSVEILKKINALETEKDVTCWTTFRQVEQFIATKSYSSFAMLSKIRAVKWFTVIAWQKASGLETGETITAATLRKALPFEPLDENRIAALSSDLDSEKIQREIKDYQSTAEQYRVVLAVTFDALAYKIDLKPLSSEALDLLADYVTHVAIDLLHQASESATIMRSPFIEGPQIETAVESLWAAYGQGEKPKIISGALRKDVVQALGPVAQSLFKAKVNALTNFNKNDPRSPRQVESMIEALNAVLELKLDPKAYERIRLMVRSYAKFVTSGLEPMRSDNYLNDGQYAKAKLKRKLYVDSVWMENTVHQTFPSLLKANGDIELLFRPNPGIVVKEKRKEKTVVLRDFQMNGVRDAAMHWDVLSQEYEMRPFVIDPFAAEILSETISVMTTHFLLEAQRIAKSKGKKTIDVESVGAIQDKRYVQVQPGEEVSKEWSKEREAEKQKAISGYRTMFKNATKSLGLPVPEVVSKTKVTEASPFSGFKWADIQRVMGGGVAVGDVNKDGFSDVFLAGEGLSGLYFNQAGKRFERATGLGIPDEIQDARGVVFVDYDADDDLDILLIRSNQQSLLLKQDAEGKFTDVAKSVGLVTTPGSHLPLVADFDGDGDLDIYIGYYGAADSNNRVKKGRNLPSMDGKNGSPNQMFRNDNGKFTNVTKEWGVGDTGWNLAALAFDYDDDGDQDFYLANDFGPNIFYRNDGKGKFINIARSLATDDRGSGMNVSVTDWNMDGSADFYVSNIDMFSKTVKVIFPTQDTTFEVSDDLQRGFQYISGNKFYASTKGKNGPTYQSVEGVAFEPGSRGWAWDAAFFDYENDGDDDMYLVNGWLPGSYADQQENLMFIRDKQSFYSSEEKASGFKSNGRSNAVFDFDKDGDVDMLVNNFQSAPVALENVQRRGHNWVSVILKQPGTANTNAIGAKVEVRFGKRKVTRWMTSTRGYIGQTDRLHFGLGKEKSAVATVTWPGGKTQKVDVDVNGFMTVTRSN